MLLEEEHTEKVSEGKYLFVNFLKKDTAISTYLYDKEDGEKWEEITNVLRDKYKLKISNNYNYNSFNSDVNKNKYVYETDRKEVYKHIRFK